MHPMVMANSRFGRVFVLKDQFSKYPLIKKGHREVRMSSLREKHLSDDELLPFLKMSKAVEKSMKEIPKQPHWGFCYHLLYNFSPGNALVLQGHEPEVRDAICVFSLVLRALDTVEDDTSLDAEVKVPILNSFHDLIYDPDWHFSCGRDAYKLLMDDFHHVSTALKELKSSYQEMIKETTKAMGAGMAKFICSKIETIDDYDEYCYHVSALVFLGVSKTIHASGTQVLLPESLCYSLGLFLQKTNIIHDYLEDINETPKPRMFWPPQIWRKYVDKLEDLKCEENLDKAVECLNEMITNALIHVEDFLKPLSSLNNPTFIRSCALQLIMAMGTLTLCYNNNEFFKGKVNMRLGLMAKINNRTRTMADVYGAFLDFSSLLKSKVDENKPEASILLSRIEAIQEICIDSGTLDKWKPYEL